MTADRPVEPGVGNGVGTDCPLEGVHEHAFRGRHRFIEWYEGPLDPALAAHVGASSGPAVQWLRGDRALRDEVAAEGERAAELHGEPADRPGRDWLAILAEEFGEVAMEVTKGEVPPVNRERTEYLWNLRGELVQVASVAMRWLAAVDRELGPPVRLCRRRSGRGEECGLPYGHEEPHHPRADVDDMEPDALPRIAHDGDRWRVVNGGPEFDGRTFATEERAIDAVEKW